MNSQTYFRAGRHYDRQRFSGGYAGHGGRILPMQQPGLLQRIIERMKM